MSELFAIGFLAGLALAIPVGPMAIMLVNTTIARGWRHGAAGALGMATVDFSYAFMVFLMGQVLSAFFGQYSMWMSLTGAAILVWLGVQTLARNLKLLWADDQPNANATAGKSVLASFGLFVGATAINPPTALYFLAIAPSLSGASDAGYAPIVFAIGVFVGSLIWQQGLAVAGLGLRQITGNRVRPWIGLTGGLLIIALAIKIAVDALV